MPIPDVNINDAANAPIQPKPGFYAATSKKHDVKCIVYISSENFCVMYCGGDCTTYGFNYLKEYHLHARLVW